MPAVALNPFPMYQAFDANGKPLAGGLVYTYQAGTTQPLGTYNELTGVLGNSMPVVLTTQGWAPIFYETGLAYKVRQLDSAGNVLWTVDNLVPLISMAYVTQVQQTIQTMKGTASWLDTTCVKTIQAPILFAGGVAGEWDDNVNTTVLMIFLVPYDIAPGNITFSMLRRALPGNGTAIMSTQSTRTRDQAQPLIFDSGTAANFTPTDTNAHSFNYVIPAGSNYVIGDILMVRLIRFGADAGDTFTNTIVFDGGWISYTGYASR